MCDLSWSKCLVAVPLGLLLQRSLRLECPPFPLIFQFLPVQPPILLLYCSLGNSADTGAPSNAPLLTAQFGGQRMGHMGLGPQPGPLQASLDASIGLGLTYGLERGKSCFSAPVLWATLRSWPSLGAELQCLC